MLENHQWLLDVLVDLDDYSKKNNMTELSRKIESARQTAITEIAERAAAQVIAVPLQK
ncbi:hypothetical protein LOM8899_04578 [Flavimaricola marinus]|uniref:Uncharacterized protein n=1 Tax=Flavimaricola marinus TaxID=1819565 RepID=A0A238LNC9_9RHOB|nr:hypothetical protein LOM8899_04578 [Flavimaricola marinus]